MNKIASLIDRMHQRRLSQRITGSMIILFGIFSGLILVDWYFNIEPQFRAAEQAKADILMISNSVPIAQALSSDNLNQIKSLANQLLLLEDPITGNHLISGVEVETLDGNKIVDEKPGTAFKGFTSESILFSHDKERNMLGNIRIYYSDQFFNEIKKDSKRRLIMTIGFLIGILVIIRLLLGYFLRPLSQLALGLREFDPKETQSLVELKGPKSFEVNQVKSAMDELLAELKEYQENLEKRVIERTIELSQLNETLKSEIEERKETEKALQIAKEKAEAASRAKSEFLANMSHEIRTPMNSVIGLTSLALNLDLTPKLRSYLNTVQTSAQSLLGIIDDILDFSKIEAGGLELDYIDFWLQDSMEKISDMFCEVTSKKGIELIIQIADDVPCALTGDPLRLEQVLINLTNNAVKFTDYGEVFLKVAVQDKTLEQANLFFSIRDTGIGINKADLAKLFDPFTQVDGSTTRKYGGTGLGLTICKRLVELMGGEINAKSEKGKGSTFQFTIKLKRQPEEKERKIVTPKDIRYLKVLVVDDNATSLAILKSMLESFTFKVALSSSGLEGIEKLKKSFEENDPFQLILIDWRMEGLDGIAASEIIKQDSRLKNVPIIMMTAFGREREQKRAEEIGINAFLIKPVKQSLLFNTIMEIFGHEKIRFVEKQPKILTKESIIFSKLRGASVLLVEDNHINQEVATEILNTVGIFVDTANNGLEAIEAVQKNRYDCVLMDVQMPQMDGYEATETIRSNPEFETLPIIAMTAHAMKGDREKCLIAGMNDYVSKPINPSALFNVMAKWITASGFQKDDRGQAVRPVETKKAPKLPAHLPGINVEDALLRLSGNTALLVKLLRDLAKEYNDAPERIKDAIEQNQIHIAKQDAHSLKGIAGNLSATNLQKASAEVEAALKTGTLDSDSPLLAKLKTAINQILDAVSTLDNYNGKSTSMDTESTTGPPQLDMSELQPMLMELEQFIQKRDPVNTEKVMIQLKPYFDNTHLDRDFYDLESQINNYDFKKAFELLNNISKALDVSLQKDDG